MSKRILSRSSKRTLGRRTRGRWGLRQETGSERHEKDKIKRQKEEEMKDQAGGQTECQTVMSHSWGAPPTWEPDPGPNGFWGLMTGWELYIRAGGAMTGPMADPICGGWRWLLLATHPHLYSTTTAQVRGQDRKPIQYFPLNVCRVTGLIPTVNRIIPWTVDQSITEQHTETKNHSHSHSHLCVWLT